MAGGARHPLTGPSCPVLSLPSGNRLPWQISQSLPFPGECRLSLSSCATQLTRCFLQVEMKAAAPVRLQAQAGLGCPSSSQDRGGPYLAAPLAPGYCWHCSTLSVVTGGLKGRRSVLTSSKQEARCFGMNRILQRKLEF